MKKILNISVVALALFGAIACNTAPVEEITGNHNTITASLASSRTALAEGVKTVWSAEDKIEVNGTIFTLTSGAGDATAVFISEQHLADAASYTATYPAGVTAIPTAQSAVAGSFDPAAALASATTTTLNNLLFEHQHALLKFAVAADAQSVEILGYTLSGEIKAGSNYYLAVAAGEYQGLTATVDGVVMMIKESQITLVNGHIYNLGTLEQQAQSVGIRTADDLLAFAAAVEAQIVAEQTPDGGEWKDEKGVVNILADIDMTGKEWNIISNFTGTLEGNNFTIDNLVFETTDSSAAMFKNLSDATIQNLTIGEGCKFSATGVDSDKKSYAASVVARIMTGATLKNITNYATISDAAIMGGICAGADLKGGDILFEGCKNYGAVTFPAKEAVADVKVGGVCGYSELGVIYRDCLNTGAVTILSTGGNKYNIIGGVVGQGSDQKMYNCSNSGALKYDVLAANNLYIGGISGRNHRIHAESCANTGTIEFTNQTTCNSIYAGGCFGSAEGTSTADYDYLKCSNTADISIACNNSANILVGGIVAYFRNDGCYVNECTNSGNLTLSTTVTNSMAGGIVGYGVIVVSDKVSRDACVYKCENTGNIKFEATVQKSSWMKVAGIVGATSSNEIVIDGCVNRGNVTKDYLTRSNPGGIISESKSDVKNCINYGTIYTTSSHVDYYSGTGGIVSRMEAAQTVSGCINYGTIIYNGKGFTTANTNKGIVGQGGIVGLLNKGTVDNCENYGVILGNDYDASLGKAEYVNAKGSIVGWGGASAAVSITNCKVGGFIGNCVDTDEDMGASKATAVTADNYADYIYGGDAKNGVTATDCVFATQQ